MQLVRVRAAGAFTVRELVAALALGPCLAAGCDASPASTGARAAAPADSAEQVMYGVHTVLTSRGTRRGEVAADTATSFAEGTRYELRGVRATFATTEARPLATVTAREATYSLADVTLEMREQVVIVSDTSGRRLEAPVVRWDSGRNELSSDSAFVATAGPRRLTGIGFVSDPELFTLRCLRECTGTLGR